MTIQCEKLWELGIGGVVTVVSVLGSAYLAYRYALKKLRKETPLLLRRDLYNKEVNALQGLWKLLQYTTDNENKKSILIYEQTEVENKKQRTWFLVVKNGKEFKHQIVDFFYGQGAGLFLDKKLKDLLFEYDRHLYGILLSEKDNNEDKIKIRSRKLPNRMIEIHEELTSLLKKKINQFPNNGI